MRMNDEMVEEGLNNYIVECQEIGTDIGLCKDGQKYIARVNGKEIISEELYIIDRDAKIGPTLSNAAYNDAIKNNFIRKILETTGLEKPLVLRPLELFNTRIKPFELYQLEAVKRGLRDITTKVRIDMRVMEELE